MELKKLFDNLSDCYADTWIEMNGKMKEGQVIPAMTYGAFCEAVNIVLKAGNKK